MQDIVLVSGLPRSGTSLMMQMLERGGIEVVSDQVRKPDEDNPRGYYELETVKSLAQDASWLPEVRGKAIKVISQLLFALPATESYAAIVMQRDLSEVLASQTAMLKRLGRTGGGHAETLQRAFVTHLEKLEKWLPAQSHIRSLQVQFTDALADPNEVARQLSQFLDRDLNTDSMAQAIDPSLYRNRTGS